MLGIESRQEQVEFINQHRRNLSHEAMDKFKVEAKKIINRLSSASMDSERNSANQSLS
jgi:hypothetical protein